MGMSSSSTGALRWVQPILIPYVQYARQPLENSSVAFWWAQTLLINCTEWVTCLIIIWTTIPTSCDRLDKSIVQPWSLGFLWISLEFWQGNLSEKFKAIICYCLLEPLNECRGKVRWWRVNYFYQNIWIIPDWVILFWLVKKDIFIYVYTFMYFILKEMLVHGKMKKHDSPHLEITIAKVCLFIYGLLSYTHIFSFLCN